MSEEAQRTAWTAELLYKALELSVNDMARSLRICKATFYKYLHHRRAALLAQSHCRTGYLKQAGAT